MWIFGQVWFACLVGFAVGVLLDWVVRVRPLSNRVAELEQRLAASGSAGPDGDGRSVFDRGAFAPANPDSDGFVAQRNRGGLLTPSRDRGPAPATDLISSAAAESTQVRSGVDDFPGVSRLSNWEAEAEEATRNAPEPWSPAQHTTQQRPVVDDTEPEWQPIPSSTEPQADEAWRTELSPPVQPPPPTDAQADEQYLEFLRAGAAHAPTAPVPDEDGTGEAEVTSVLPFPIGEQTDTDGPRIDGYEAYENYTEDYPTNGHQEAGGGYVGDAYEADYRYGQYQPEEVEEPEEPGSPLPRRGASTAGSLRFAPFQPFQPFQPVEEADVAPQAGELTPIQDGGWQPFQKPAGVPADDGYDNDGYDDNGHDNGYDNSYDNGGYDGESWQPTDGQLVGSPHNGAHALHGGDLAGTQEDGDGTWHDLGQRPDLAPGEITMTHRMLPVSRPDLDHPDLLGQSVFGGAGDAGYDEDGSARSLFEPVIPADVLQDDFATPGYPGPPGHDGGPRTDEFLSPRPMRVRTGVDGPATQSMPATAPVPPPYGSTTGTGGTAGDAAAGPFGPGSALPLPDGSPPAPEFRIKARTSSMVFHTESSPFYERLEPQVWFRNQEDAQRAGFTSWERPRTW